MLQFYIIKAYSEWAFSNIQIYKSQISLHNLLYIPFQSPLWLGIGVKTSNIKMMIFFDTCFTEAWRWSILNIVYKVHPNLKAVCSTGHIGADRILFMLLWQNKILSSYPERALAPKVVIQSFEVSFYKSNGKLQLLTQRQLIGFIMFIEGN